MTTVAIADDQRLMRTMLANVVNGFEGFRVVALAANGVDLIEQIRDTGSPDILLLDLSMPIMDGEEIAIWMRDYHPTTKVLILTMFSKDDVKRRLLCTGIRGFLTKEIIPDDLEIALNEVKNNATYFVQEDKERIIVLFQQLYNGTASILTDREVEYVKLCFSPYTHKEIAEQMKLSPRTIQNLIDSIYRKIKIRSRTGLAMYAVRNGLVHVD